MKDVEVYIETSLKGPQKGTGRVAYFMRAQKGDGTMYDSILEIAEYDGATESSLTLHALIDAMGRLKYACKVTVHTESFAAANAISRNWLREWHDHGWRNSRDAAVRNADLWGIIWQMTIDPGHELAAVQGKHDWVEWMAWNMQIGEPLKGVFKKISQN